MRLAFHHYDFCPKPSQRIHVDLDESTSTLVPTLHTLFSRPQGPIRASSSPLNLDLRSRIISWIATEALSGDEVAAEWVLLSCLAKVYAFSALVFMRF